MITRHRAKLVEEGMQLCADCGTILAEAYVAGGIVMPGAAGVPRKLFYDEGESVHLNEEGGVVSNPVEASPCVAPRGRRRQPAERPAFLPQPKGPGA